MFGYILEKATNRVISYWDLNEKPADNELHSFIECTEQNKPELYRPEPPLVYNAKTFLQSCAVDSTLQVILAKLSDRQYFDLSACLQNKNFDMLKVFIEQHLSNEVITAQDVSYFENKLLTECGVDLGA